MLFDREDYEKDEPGLDREDYRGFDGRVGFRGVLFDCIYMSVAASLGDKAVKEVH